MARGLHRFAEMELRYGTYGQGTTGNKFLRFRQITSSGSVALPRGDFRISVFGGGAGGNFYISNTNLNATGVFTGQFGVVCGGRGGVVVFDVHIPADGTVATCTVGAGGKGKNASNAAAGGQSKVVISDLGITVIANGGSVGTASTSAANCKPGIGGTVSATGVTPVLSLAKSSVDIDNENIGQSRYNNGKNFTTRLDWNYNNGALGELTTSFCDDETAYDQLLAVGPRDEPRLFTSIGLGGNADVRVAHNDSTDRYRVAGYVISEDWYWCGGTESGYDGAIIIERL